ncbi:hypothetical protein [Streptomyces sp. Ncost-T10-10d]|uniref:hypothetical protein n=1 Tax=Streptomyces sp. Ncost-T10-10d TaxID=1839774 RepID=UPI00210AFF6A|nr:hypothetical protein [Streptomyces sp. Ncost-T10-10d]
MSGCDAAVTRRAHMVAVVTQPEDLTAPRLRGLAGVADALEVRADLVGDPDPHRLRRHFTGPVTYSLRSPRHGGRSAAGPVERRTRLLRAAGHYDMVDLEAVDDLVPELLAGIPARQRRVSWHQPELARPERSADRGPACWRHPRNCGSGSPRWSPHLRCCTSSCRSRESSTGRPRRCCSPGSGAPT